MLFTAAADTTQIEDVVYQLARYLALWGDSVLVLDARSLSRSDPNPFLRPGDRELPSHAAGDVVALVDPATPPRGSTGLSHVLQSGEDETAHVRDTPLTGVQYFPVGAVFPDADLLASAGMHRLLVRMSERYDRILILGPSLGQPVAVEILAGYADGAVVALPRCESESPDVAKAVQAVRSAGVPWVGAVVRS
jgi:Mrp family chromosome partitioning ATPase